MRMWMIGHCEEPYIGLFSIKNRHCAVTVGLTRVLDCSKNSSMFVPKHSVVGIAPDNYNPAVLCPTLQTKIHLTIILYPISSTQLMFYHLAESD